MTSKISVVKFYTESDTTTTTEESLKTCPPPCQKQEHSLLSDVFFTRPDETILYGIDKVCQYFQSSCKPVVKKTRPIPCGSKQSTSSFRALKREFEKLKCANDQLLKNFECTVSAKAKANCPEQSAKCDALLEKKLCDAITSTIEQRQCEERCSGKCKCCSGSCECRCKCQTRKTCRKNCAGQCICKSCTSFKIKNKNCSEKLLNRNTYENIELTRTLPTESCSHSKVVHVSYEKIDKKAKLSDDNQSVRKTLKIKRYSSPMTNVKQSSHLWSPIVSKSVIMSSSSRRPSLSSNQKCGEKKLKDICCKYPIPKVIKTQFAITQVNYFDDNSRTYEVTKPQRNCYDFFTCPRPTNVIFAVLPDGSTVSYRGSCPPSRHCSCLSKMKLKAKKCRAS